MSENERLQQIIDGLIYRGFHPSAPLVKALQDIADGCAPMTARDVILALAYAVNDYNRDKVL